jgi:hypothetical protein
MITIHWSENIFNCEYAVQKLSSILMYDSDFNLTNEIDNIYGKEWQIISIEGGTWTDPSEIPTETDRLQASIDYLDMQAESLEASDEANRADIDYCLMMLDDGATDEQLDDTTTEETGTTVTDEPTTDSTTDDGDTTDEQLG